MNPEEQTPKQDEKRLSQIRTFQGDMAEAIEKQNESIVSIQRAEVTRTEKRALTPEELEKRQNSRRSLIYALLTLTLVGLGGVGAYFAYNTYKEKTAVPTVAIPDNQFVGANIVNVDASTLSRQTVIGAVTLERNKNHATSSITQIEMRRGKGAAAPLLSAPDFLTRLNVHAPQPLIRALNDLFMLGILGTPSHAFIIIQIDSFQNAFPGMLDWEPRIAEDLLPLFSDTAEVPTGTLWRDLTLENRDTRILRDPNGGTALVYGFFENKLLIIADSEDTFRSIAKRLESQKLQR